MRLESEANKRGHWTKSAKRAADTRGAVALVFRTQRGGPTPGQLALDRGMVVTITRVAPRKLDSDNLARACKAVRDGVADWLGVDDGDPRITWRTEQRKDKRPNYYGVEVCVQGRKRCDTCGQAVTAKAARDALSDMTWEVT